MLILDEPFSGLDPVSVRTLKEVIAEEQRRGATILFSTHLMAHAEELCQHVVMIHRGRKVLDEPMAGLRRQYDRGVIQFEPLNPAAELSVLRGTAGVREVRPTADGCDLYLLDSADTVAVMREMPAPFRPRGFSWPASGSKTSSSGWWPRKPGPRKQRRSSGPTFRV